jgi:hypothetical protein
MDSIVNGVNLLGIINSDDDGPGLFAHVAGRPKSAADAKFKLDFSNFTLHPVTIVNVYLARRQVDPELQVRLNGERGVDRPACPVTPPWAQAYYAKELR